MDLTNLLRNFENLVEKNNQNFKDIHNNLYFDNEDFVPSSINETKHKDIASIKKEETKIETTFLQFKNKNKIIFDSSYNYVRKYTFVEAVMTALNFKEDDCKEKLFKRINKEYNVYKLHKKFNYDNICKKNELKKLLQEKNDNNDLVRNFIADYLSINIISFTNEDIKLFAKDRKYEIFRPTVYVYENEEKIYMLREGKKTIFNSDDIINYKLQRISINSQIKQVYNDKQKQSKTIEKIFKENIIKEEKVEQTPEPVKVEKECPPAPKKSNLNKLKVTELKKIAKEQGIKGYSKMKKADLVKALQ